MSHAPAHWTLKVATPAALAAYTASFDSGDEADVDSLGFTFVYDPASLAVVDHVTVEYANGNANPLTAGRWLRGVAAVSQNDRNRHAQFVDTTDPATGLATAASVASNVAPVGGGADDSAPLHTKQLAHAFADEVGLAAGLYFPQTAQIIPAGTRLNLGAGATFVSSVPKSAGIAAPFYATWQYGTPTSLAAQATRGDTSITLTSAQSFSVMPVASTGTAPPIVRLTGTLACPFPLRVECTLGGARGVWTGRYTSDGGITWAAFTSAATVAVGTTGVTMEIQNVAASADNVWTASRRGRIMMNPGGPASLTIEVACYSIAALSGVTLTLTRPVLRTWLIGGDGIGVYPITTSDDTVIHGSGSTITGVCDRAIEFVGAEHPMLSGIRAEGAFSDMVVGFDLANHMPRIDRSYVSGNGTGIASYSLEASEDGLLSHVFGHGTYHGAVFPSIDHAAIEHSAFWSCTYGVSTVCNDATTTEGSHGLLSLNVRTALCTEGVHLVDDGRDTTLVGGTCDLGTYGARAYAGGVTGRVSTYSAFIGWSARNNTGVGISLEAASVGNRGACLHLADNAGGALSITAGATKVLTATEIEDTGAAVANPLVMVSGAGSELRLSTSRIVSTGALGSPGVLVASSGFASLDGCSVKGVAGNGPAFKNTGGTLRIARTRAVGAWPTGIYTAPGQRTDIGEDVDLSSCGVVRPYALLSTAGSSVALGGGTTIAAIGTGAATVELVVKLDATNAGLVGLGGLHDATNISAATFLTNGADLFLYYRNGVSTAHITYTGFWTGRLARYVMLHAVLTGAGHIILYADGVLVTDSTVTYNLSTAGSACLGLLDNMVQGMSGVHYQQLKLWTRALSQTDVTARFNWDENTAAMRTSLVGEYLMTEGSGAAVADGSGGSRPLALTTLPWTGTPWVSQVVNHDGTHTARLWSDVAVVALGGIGHEATPAEWRCQTQRLTGALTGDVQYYLPKLRGAIWTIDQRTTGGHNVNVGGVNGATVACASGITRVTCDGTDFSAA